MSFSFGLAGAKDEPKDASKEDAKPASGGFNFSFAPPASGASGASSSPFGFSGFKQSADGPLQFGSSTSTFSFAPSTFGSTTAAKKDDDDDEGDQDDGEDDGATPAADESHAADFKPIANLSLVEVRTMEENEDVLFQTRSKLFVYIKEDIYGGEVRKNWWKERGLGDLKVLKDRTTSNCRLLMRQEKTLKICLNHMISPLTNLQPGMEDKFLSFFAVDFADEKVKEDMFLLKFPSKEVAEKFKQHFDEAKAFNKSALDSKGASPAKSTSAISQLASESSSKSIATPLNTAEKTEVAAAPKADAVKAVALSSSLPQEPANKPAHAPLAGGYSKADPESVEVRAAADFAVEKIGKGKLVKVASVKKQVVAGLNYRMALHLSYPNGEIHAHVVTVYQPLPHTKQPLKLAEEIHTGIVQ